MKTRPEPEKRATASAPILETVAVRGLLGAIAADRHAAPPSPAPSRVVDEHQRAAMSFARPHVSEILLAHELRQRLADRQQQGLGDRHRRFTRSSRRPPSPLRSTVIRLNVSSRSKSRFRGVSSRIAPGGSGRPMCLRTKPLNHSRSARASPATLSSSPSAALSVAAFSASCGTRFASASHTARPSPLSSQSTGRSTGVAMELRKSRPGESAMKSAGVLSGATAFRITECGLKLYNLSLRS